jgi:DNA helicase-2/ATP-dependent DNA helicase PcrA
MDFDDLIMKTVEVLQRYPDARSRYRHRFKHILVDEYQDTNHAQYILIRELVGTDREGIPAAELCVVGDADQSIYGFRGATIRNILQFEEDYPDATTILLEQNYRSTQNILTAANAVIAKNESRKEKNLWSEAGSGVKLQGFVAENEHHEAEYIRDEIVKLQDEGKSIYGQTAIFYRTNAQSRVFEEVFMRSAIQSRWWS